MRFLTNAKTLQELDLALLEVERLGNLSPVSYHAPHAIETSADSRTDTILARAAFVEGRSGIDGSVETPPSIWEQMREHRVPGLQDHSTHNLFPFEGKMRPQLARALVNIACGDNGHALVLDPFMGSGTVLLEAYDAP